MRTYTVQQQLAPAALALVALISACTTSSGPARSRIEHTPDGSFTITQDLRVGGGVRDDFNVALHLLEQEDYEGGIERLLEVTQAAPKLATAHINLGIAYRHLEDWPRAAASLERALELNPRHPVAHNELGIVRRRQGLFEEARASYEEALAVAADFHFARRNLAILCDLFLSDASCALENYERYAQAVPDDEQVGIWIADLRSRTDGSAPGAR